MGQRYQKLKAMSKQQTNKSRGNQFSSIALRLGAIAVFLLTSAASCKHKQYLTGYFSWDEFQKKAAWDVFVDEKYKPREATLDSIQALSIHDSLRVNIFLGTYCSDSKHWVPRFFKMKDRLPVNEVNIISLDTTKVDEKGMAKAAGVEKGSGEPNKKIVGKVTKAQLKEIAEMKLPDLNTTDVEQAMKIIAGTAKNMGIEVKG